MPRKSKRAKKTTRRGRPPTKGKHGRSTNRKLKAEMMDKNQIVVRMELPSWKSMIAQEISRAERNGSNALLMYVDKHLRLLNVVAAPNTRHAYLGSRQAFVSLA